MRKAHEKRLEQNTRCFVRLNTNERVQHFIFVVCFFMLAFTGLMVWHLYEVHLRPRKYPIDNMWLTGMIDEEEMREEYPLHYKKIMNDPELQAIYMREGSKADD